MARAKPLEKYIYDIPCKERFSLCRILDAEGSWLELGAQMDIDRITLALIGNAVQRHQSPTDELLTKLGDKNITINRLFRKLYEIEQYRAMRILKPFVNEKYLTLLRDDRNDSETIEFSHKSSNLISKQFSTNSDVLEKSDHWKNKSDPNNLNNNYSASVTKLQNNNYNERRNSPPKRTIDHHLVEDNQYSDIKILNKESRMNLLSQNTYDKNNLKNDSHKSPNSNKKQLKTPDLSNFEDQKREHDEKAFQKEGKIPHTGSKKHKTAASEFSSLEEAIPSISIKQISYIDIVKATNNFSPDKILGQGGFGIVYKGELWDTLVAIKRLKPKNDHNKISKEEVSIKQSLNELKFLNCARIDNILPLYGVSLDGQEPCLVYQYMDNGSLEDRLRCKSGTTPLNWFQRSLIAIGTAKGLNYLHTADKIPLIHGDIKSANILLDSNFTPKIGDFGLTREGPLENRTHTKVTTVHGTQPYLPLEYLKYHKLSTKVDIYSYGVVLLEIATGQRAYDKSREKKHLLVDYVVQCIAENLENKIIDKKAGEEGIPWFNMFVDTGIKCTSKNKNERPEMAQVLDHFKEFQNAVEKLRRSSNDFNHPPNLNQLSPLDLQLAHDIFREQIHPAKNQHPFQIDFSKLQLPKTENAVVRGPPASDNINISDIKAPPSDNSLERKCFLSPIKPQENSSMAVIINTNHSNSCQPDLPAGNVMFTSNPSLPLITILNQQGNVSNDLGSPPSRSCVLSDINNSDKIMNMENSLLTISKLHISHESDDDDEENYLKNEPNINN